jgi:ABC-type glutathione transport system ATPase component
MNIIELKNYVLDADVRGRRLEPFDFTLAGGDMCFLSTDSMDDALTFLKALATLIRPRQGAYLFKGEPLNLSDHDGLLSVKKQIGFITSHSALISNRSLREKLNWIRDYHENTFFSELDDETRKLCELFSILRIIDLRPSEVSPRDCHLAITIRELAKSPEFLLLENPEDYIGLVNFGIFWDLLENRVKGDLPVVFLSNSKSFIRAFSNRKLVISQGKLREAPL